MGKREQYTSGDNSTMRCPVCGFKDTLVFEREALIQMELINGAVLPKHFALRDVNLLEGGILTCYGCGETSDDNDELDQILNFLMQMDAEEDEDGNTRKCTG